MAWLGHRSDHGRGCNCDVRDDVKRCVE
jgi:hypothetical protein